MKKSCAILIACFLVILLCAGEAGADSIYLKNGNIMNGRIVKETEDSIVIEMYGGKVGIEKNEIRKIERSEPAAEEPEEEGEPELSVDKINASYYSPAREGAKKIKFKLDLSSTRLAIGKLGRGKTEEFTRKFKTMSFLVTYDLKAACVDDAIDISISDKPSFEDEDLNKMTSDLIEIGENMAGWFLGVWFSYATTVIDKKRWNVESIKYIEKDKEIKVKLVKDDKERKLTFDRGYKLKDWHSFEYNYSEEPKFEQYKSKYLLKSIFSNKFGRMEIQYHVVDRINLPKNVYMYGDNVSAPDGVLTFVSLER